MSEVRILAADGDITKQVAILNSVGNQTVVSHASAAEGNTTRFTHHKDGHAHLKLWLTDDSPEKEHVLWEVEGPRPNNFRGFIFANWFTIPNDLADLEGRLDFDSADEDTHYVRFNTGAIDGRTSFAVYLLGPSYGEDELPAIIDMIGFDPSYIYHHIGKTEPQVGIVFWGSGPQFNSQLPEYDESEFEPVA